MAARRRTSLYQLRMTILLAVSALDETRPVRLRRTAFTIDCKSTDFSGVLTLIGSGHAGGIT
jgi:hypothetical protein